MNKSELLTKLNGKFYKVGNATVRATDEFGIKYYLVKVYDAVGETLRDTNIAFYIENEGNTNETAYWNPSEPKPDPVIGFAQEVNDYLSQKITDGAIEGVSVVSVDRQNETAITEVVMTDANKLIESRLFLDKDGAGNLRDRAIE